MIRQAKREDLPLIVQLIEELADYEKLRNQCSVSAAGLEPHLFGPHPLIHCLIAEAVDENSGKPVAAGFALYFFNFSTFACKAGIYLEDLFIRPAFRGRGLGRELFSALAAAANRSDCARFEWSVLDWNEPAIGFYKRLGAIPMNEWTVYRLTGEALESFAA